jgi:lactate dehydrogenase-like 2-hydroxyacid dehydrogenase
LGEHFDLRINQENRGMTQEELGAALAWADVVCPTVTDAITADLLGAAQVKTKLLANFGVGFNHIDTATASRRGIAVTNTPGVLTDATAEIALTLLLSTARRTAEGERLVRAGKWAGWHPTHMLSTQVSGKSLGIIGLGRIGLAFARQAHFGLGMQIFYSGRRPQSAHVLDGLPARYCGLEELLEQSDFVSLHCPATEQTRHLINSETLALMKPEAHLINTARGDVVHESDLVRALSSGVIAGAGLDVYEAEPKLAKGLVELANVVLLPHMGSGTTQTRVAMGECALANIRAFAAGEPLPNQVG